MTLVWRSFSPRSLVICRGGSGFLVFFWSGFFFFFGWTMSGHSLLMWLIKFFMEPSFFLFFLFLNFFIHFLKMDFFLQDGLKLRHLGFRGHRLMLYGIESVLIWITVEKSVDRIWLSMKQILWQLSLKALHLKVCCNYQHGFFGPNLFIL